jgi:hypothetical protein
MGVEIVDAEELKIAAKLNEINKKLDEIKSLLTSQTSNAPWVFKLVMELNLGVDEDGNGMIFGRDFGLAENANHVPPSLQPMVGLMRRQGWSGTTLSWEQYLESLPESDHKKEVERFVNSLPERHVRPREAK